MTPGVMTVTPLSAEQLREGRVRSAGMRYHTEYRFTDRAGRCRYVAEKYAPLLGGSVLDVGCDQRSLRAHLPRPDLYTGVDIAPPADVVIDLDRQELPFSPGSFDAVVCTDVLEHLERIHAVFDALCRTARRSVIVSLPAPVNNLLSDIGRGTEAWKKYYGLPVDPPTDRHRWFFGFEDARRFIVERAGRIGWRVEQLDCEWDGCGNWKSPEGRELLADPNLRKGALWCALEPVR